MPGTRSARVKRGGGQCDKPQVVSSLKALELIHG